MCASVGGCHGEVTNSIQGLQLWLVYLAQINSLQVNREMRNSNSHSLLPLKIIWIRLSNYLQPVLFLFFDPYGTWVVRLSS